ncbi:DNA repair protein RecO [Veillonella sp.]|uniref:DNA repair protein RecO n=1 Tax=Veillonella sp. TaxID=1926307 RepID=UPI0025F14BFB|nr:DNA repair protein RecO [Veillonella sp.]
MSEPRLTINCEAIVLYRRKRKTYSIVTFLTKQRGLISCSIPQRRWQTLKNVGYLQPFSKVYITLSPNGEYYDLQQIDGVYLIRAIESDLDSICYASFGGELISTAFAQEELDLGLYELVERFSKLIQTKSVPLAVILLGWQLLSIAGFVPAPKAYKQAHGVDRFVAEFTGSTGFNLSRQAQAALGEVLNYNWDPQLVVQLPRSLWLELERGLFAYATVQLGEELSSLRFLYDMKAKAF